MTSECQPPILTVENVTKVFPGQVALNDVTLSIGEAKIHALVGANGSGKSTLIKILTGIYRADNGVARTGALSHDLTAGRGTHELPISCVHQDRGLIDELSVMDNIGLGDQYATSKGWLIDWRRQSKQTRALLNRVGIGQLPVMTKVASLDELTKTQVALARAIGRWRDAAGLLILDEPTANMSREPTLHLFQLLKQIRAEGHSVLYVSHKLDEVLELCDDVSVLREGQLVHSGPASALSSKSIVEHMLGHEAGKPNTSIVSSRVEQVGRERARLTDLHLSKIPGVLGRPVTFSILEGEILGLAGVTGAGQDDIPLALVGVVAAAGSLHISERQIRLSEMNPLLAKKLGIALVPPNRKTQGIVGEFTVSDNITISILSKFLHWIAVLDQRQATAEAVTWIGRVGLQPPSPFKKVKLLSGGNQQKSIIARCLATEPQLLILADPTAGVDIGAREQIWRIIRDEANRGLSVLVTSSDTADLAALCDRVLVVRDAEIVDEIEGSDITERRLEHAIQADAQDATRTPAFEAPPTPYKPSDGVRYG